MFYHAVGPPGRFHHAGRHRFAGWYHLPVRGRRQRSLRTWHDQHHAGIPERFGQRGLSRRDDPDRRRQQSQLHIRKRNSLGKRQEDRERRGRWRRHQPLREPAHLSERRRLQLQHDDADLPRRVGRCQPHHRRADLRFLRQRHIQPLVQRLRRHEPFHPHVGGDHCHRRRGKGDRRAGLARRFHPDLARTLLAALRRLPRHHQRQHRQFPHVRRGRGLRSGHRFGEPRRQQARSGPGRLSAQRNRAQRDRRVPGGRHASDHRGQEPRGGPDRRFRLDPGNQRDGGVEHGNHGRQSAGHGTGGRHP